MTQGRQKLVGTWSASSLLKCQLFTFTLENFTIYLEGLRINCCFAGSVTCPRISGLNSTNRHFYLRGCQTCVRLYLHASREKVIFPFLVSAPRKIWQWNTPASKQEARGKSHAVDPRCPPTRHILAHYLFAARGNLHESRLRFHRGYTAATADGCLLFLSIRLS